MKQITPYHRISDPAHVFKDGIKKLSYYLQAWHDIHHQKRLKTPATLHQFSLSAEVHTYTVENFTSSEDHLQCFEKL